jgi:predicted transcriptional regulator
MTKKLKIHVGGGVAAVKRRVAKAWAKAESGEDVHEDHLTFVSWEALAQAMTSKRFALLRHLHRNPAASVAALARALGRDYKHVHEDVKALSSAGLIERDESGLRADYDEIRTIIAL